MLKISTFLLLLLPTFYNAQNQQSSADYKMQSDSSQNGAPKIFIDCFFCDIKYMKQNMPYFNYVRDRKFADVHIMGFRQLTGSGGWEESFEFIGLNNFNGMIDTLITIIGPNTTSEEKRISETKLFKLGIIRFAAKTPISDDFSIIYNAPVEQKTSTDSWKNWVFEISGNGWIGGSDVYKSTYLWSYFNVEKVSPKFRFEFNISADYNETKQELSDQTFTSILKGQDLNSEAVWSISDHWSWGIFGQAQTSIYNNYTMNCDVKPGIEYNLFPYSESTKKQLRISYRIGLGYNKYNETTIFNINEELIPIHRLSVAHRIREKWGNVNVGVWANQYLHNTNLYSLRIFSNLNLRIIKGLNFNISGNFGITQDQISLSKSGLSDEQILAGQGQRATNYTFNTNLGLSYTFGSIFNSIVNPRFR
ncbi:MAG: hypothetical protein P8M05_11280 [Flavobacteriales bacterium]|nr:hypothetical protein [Flavobacteriales bacterium]